MYEAVKKLFAGRCEEEKVSEESAYDNDDDGIYNRAIRDCIDTINALTDAEIAAAMPKAEAVEFLSAGEILSLERRSNMTQDETLRFARAVESAVHRYVAAPADRRELVEALRTLGRRFHYYCEDCWYSCPKAEDGCCNEAQGSECNCGADEHNAKLDAILAREGAKDE